MGDKLWSYVGGLRHGDDHDPEEELRALLPTARLVSDALKGGGEGPEHLSEAALMAAIARSEERRFAPRRRGWALPAFAVTGWVAATTGFSLFAYQYGMSHGLAQTRIAAQVERPLLPIVTEPLPLPEKVEKPAPKRVMPKREAIVKKPAEPMPELPPSVRVDEIEASKDLIASLSITPDDATVDAEQNNLIREGSTHLAQGEWEKAFTSFEQAASKDPEDEAAMDALHLSGRIAEQALNDPQLASRMYRREIEVGQRILETRKDAPVEPVKQRLARALTNVGLLEKNPRMIRQATEETKSESGVQ